tara:strand:- start:7124 stop:7537 length:414 start_codon:yes stop_codon:yes gene_type:complete
MRNVFDWVKEINTKKSPIDSFSTEDWDQWNSYVVHRVLSMNPDYLSLVNEVQKLPPDNKKQIYSIYKEYIPKNNKWSKYVKSTVKPRNKDLIELLKGYYQLSSREVKEYIYMLDNEEILRILSKMGVNQKDAKKLIK